MIRDRLWDPTARSWKVAWLNLAGSIAFGISAVGAYVAPGSDQPSNVAVANLGTFVGALGFLAGALLMSPRPGAGRSSRQDDVRPAARA